MVCTISLGSHTVFNYYRYENLTVGDLAQSDKPQFAEVESSKGRSIDPRPIASVLLERRSLIITRSSLYSDYLHGIEPIDEDVVPPAEDYNGQSLRDSVSGPSILNHVQISDSSIREIATLGGKIKRDTRVSLTCRDVEHVAGSKLYRK